MKTTTKISQRIARITGIQTQGLTDYLNIIRQDEELRTLTIDWLSGTIEDEIDD